jgi:hypothetical protein
MTDIIPTINFLKRIGPAGSILDVEVQLHLLPAEKEIKHFILWRV